MAPASIKVGAYMPAPAYNQQVKSWSLHTATSVLLLCDGGSATCRGDLNQNGPARHAVEISARQLWAAEHKIPFTSLLVSFHCHHLHRRMQLVAIVATNHAGLSGDHDAGMM